MKPPIDLGKLESWELGLITQLNNLEEMLARNSDKLPPILNLIAAIDEFRDELVLKLCNESQ